MSAPLAPAAVEAELERLSLKLKKKSDELAGLLEAAARADVAFRLSYAKALLRADGDTVSEREAEATLATADELTERKTNGAVADAARESIRSLREQLGACRSINANTRTQAGLSL